MSTANEGVSFAQEKLNDFNDNILGPVGDALEYMAQWALIHVPVGIEKVSFSSNLSTADVGYLNVGMCHYQRLSIEGYNYRRTALIYHGWIRRRVAQGSGWYTLYVRAGEITVLLLFSITI